MNGIVPCGISENGPFYWVEFNRITPGGGETQLDIITKDGIGWNDRSTGGVAHACIEWGEEYPRIWTGDEGQAGRDRQ